MPEQETRLRVLHRIAVTQYQAGSAHRWKACLAASCVVGKYDKGATLALAGDLCISVSQVENLAHAGLAWRWLRYYGVRIQVRTRLTPSHFSAMLDLWRRYEFDPQAAADTLQIAAENGASVMVMRQWIDDEFGPDRGDMWQRRLGRVLPQVELLVNDYGVPEGVRIAAQQFIAAVNGEHGAQHETNLSVGERAAPELE